MLKLTNLLMNLSVLSLAFFLSISANAAMDNYVLGTVKVRGSVITSTCTIDVSNKDQTVNLAPSVMERVISKRVLYSMNISLVHCILKSPLQKYFQITIGSGGDEQVYLTPVIVIDPYSRSGIAQRTDNDYLKRLSYASDYSLKINAANVLVSEENKNLMHINFIYF